MAFSITRVTRREWLGLATGLLALGTLFLPWTVLTAGAADADVQNAFQALPRGDVVRSAWNSDPFSWLPPFVLVLIGVAVVGLGQIRKVRMSGLPQLWLVGSLATVLLMAIGWATLDWVFDSDQRAFLDAAGITVGAGIGRYVGLLFALVSVVGAIFDIRAARAESRASRRRR